MAFSPQANYADWSIAIAHRILFEFHPLSVVLNIFSCWFKKMFVHSCMRTQRPVSSFQRFWNCLFEIAYQSEKIGALHIVSLLTLHDRRYVDQTEMERGHIIPLNIIFFLLERFKSSTEFSTLPHCSAPLFSLICFETKVVSFWKPVALHVSVYKEFPVNNGACV
jgi:hypothetical protein